MTTKRQLYKLLDCKEAIMESESLLSLLVKIVYHNSDYIALLEKDELIELYKEDYKENKTKNELFEKALLDMILQEKQYVLINSETFSSFNKEDLTVEKTNMFLFDFGIDAFSIKKKKDFSELDTVEVLQVMNAYRNHSKREYIIVFDGNTYYRVLKNLDCDKCCADIFDKDDLEYEYQKELCRDFYEKGGIL